MTTKKKQIAKLKQPIVKYSKELDKLSGTVLFPEKVAEANRILKMGGLPSGKK